MARILRFYVIRAIVTPTVMALLTITFILMVEQINNMIDLIMQPGVTLGQVMGILVAFLPSMIVFAAPMAVLVGTMIGIGRLVMDREVLAMRASGLNLLSVFAPTLIGALLISGSIMILTRNAVPHSLNTAITRTTDLSYAWINTLKAGQKYTSEDLKMKNANFLIYFQQRDEKLHEMKDIFIKLNPEKTNVIKTEKKGEEKDGKDSKDKDSKDKDAKDKDKEKEKELAAADRPTSTSAEVAALVKQLHASGLLPSSISDIQYNEELGEDLTADRRDNDVMTIFSQSGRIISDLEHSDDGKIRLLFQLGLKNGSLHLKSKDPAKRQYVMFRFANTTFTQTRDEPMTKETKMQSNRELRDQIASELEDGGEPNRKVGKARAELTERNAMPLAFFVFMLVGVPLAIRVRTGGKSWAILLAIGMMLVYFVLMQMGLAMVEEHRPLGAALAFFPNLLFIALGSLLWWQTLRS